MSSGSTERRPGRLPSRRALIVSLAALGAAACTPDRPPVAPPTPMPPPASEALPPTAVIAAEPTLTPPAKTPEATKAPSPRFAYTFNRPSNPQEAVTNMRRLSMVYYKLREDDGRPRSDIYQQAQQFTLDAATRFFPNGKPAQVDVTGEVITIGGIPYDTRSANGLAYAAAVIDSNFTDPDGAKRIAALKDQVPLVEGSDSRPFFYPEYSLSLLSAVDVLNKNGRTTPKQWESIKDGTAPSYDPSKDIGRFHFLNPLAGLGAHLVTTNPELVEAQEAVTAAGLAETSKTYLFLPPEINSVVHYIKNGSQTKRIAQQKGGAALAQYELHKKVLGVEFSANGQAISVPKTS